MLPLMKMVVYCIDKVKRFRLSREVGVEMQTQGYTQEEKSPDPQKGQSRGGGKQKESNLNM